MLKKLFSSNNRFSSIEFLIAICVIVYLVFSFQNSETVSPDGVLYHELAHNLVDGDGYIDNIRNDFILPTVGHPILILIANRLGIINPLTFTRILLFFSLIIAFFTTKELKLHRFYRILVLPIMFATIPEIYDWGVEMSLFFSVNLMVLLTVRFINHYDNKTAIALGVSIACNLLIRPIYAPFIYLFLVGVLLFMFKFKKRLIPALISLLVGVGIVNSVMLISKAKFGDKRLTAGTYSEIPLYCANNKYIDLQQVYWSSRWNELSQEDYAKAVGPLQITTTWKDRADILKKEVISFYINYPRKAMGGIVWRASKLTYDQPKQFGLILFFIWLLLSLSLFVINLNKLFITTKENYMFWLGIILPLYTTAIVSLFVYVSERYNLSSNLVFVLGIILCIPMLRNSFKKEEKVI